MGILESGQLNLKEVSISNCEAGINNIARELGIDVRQIILAGNKVGTTRGVTTNINNQLRDKMFALVESGIPTSINTAELLKTGDREFLNTMQKMIAGTGEAGKASFIPVVLDQGTSIFVPTEYKRRIFDVWGNPESNLRKNLRFLVSKEVKDQLNNPITESKAEELIQRHLKDLLEVTFDKNNVIEKGVYTNNEAAE